MIRNSFTAIACMTFLSISVLPGCTQLPTEKQSVVDLRPQISFRASDEALGMARVQVDGLDMGSVGEYLEGKAALRLLSGNHLIRVTLDSRLLLEEKLYVGDGINRTLLVK